MSLQVFLQAQLIGSENFPGSTESTGDGFAELLGRCAWLSLISEVLPRALLAEMKLSRMLLGSSGGEQFLVVLTDESIADANAFLERAAEGIAAISGGMLRLVWASTENLGAWPIAARRLEEEIERQKATPLRGHAAAGRFRPFSEPDSPASHSYFAEFGKQIVSASVVSWSPENPALLSCEPGTYTWPLRDQTAPSEDEGIAFPRRFAMNEQQEIAGPEEIATLAEGAERWAILRGDVDLFDLRLKRTNTIEERLQLSVLF